MVRFRSSVLVYLELMNRVYNDTNKTIKLWPAIWFDRILYLHGHFRCIGGEVRLHHYFYVWARMQITPDNHKWLCHQSHVLTWVASKQKRYFQFLSLSLSWSLVSLLRWLKRRKFMCFFRLDWHTSSSGSSLSSQHQGHFFFHYGWYKGLCSSGATSWKAQKEP